MKRNLLAGAIGAAILGLAASGANALTIGVYSENGAAETAAGVIITGQGHTFVNLADLSAASLAGLDIAWYMNAINGAQGQAGNAAAIAGFVSGAGVFVMNDREVDNAETVLPGGGAFSIIGDFSDAANIEVIDASTSLTNGPGGIIGNTTLDGGNFSSHGYAVAGTLPGMSIRILSRTAAAEIVDFTYMSGAGAVHYSAMPLDFYLGGTGVNPPADNYRDIYAPNLVGYAAELWQSKNQVPEPATLAIFGLGLAGLGVLRRRKAT